MNKKMFFRRVLLLLALVATVTPMFAQFPTSNEVYYYLFDYTYDDGIKSNTLGWSGYPNFQCYLFQGNYAGGTYAHSLSEIQTKAMSDPNYYATEARNKFARDIRDWNGSSNASIAQYSPELSTGNNYTYRIKERTFTGYGMQVTAPTWGEMCFSFSRDRSTLIVWKFSNPNYRLYYKRVSLSDLKPNMDFLY